MKNLNFLTVVNILIVLIIIISGGCAQKSKENEEIPVNILFVFTDDQRWDALGYAGNAAINTSTIDNLASRGTYFNNAFVTTSICCVSRASVLTGQYAHTHGVRDFFTRIDLENTYPAYLREGGYYTGFIGKWGTNETDTAYFMMAADLFDFWAGSMGQSNFWHERDCNFVKNNGTSEKHHFLCDCPPDARGKRGEEIRVGNANMKDPVHQETYVIPSKVRKFLDQRDKNKPWCLSISYKAPHGPWEDYDESFKELYKNKSMPVAASVNKDEALSQPEFLRRSLNGRKNYDKLDSAHKINSPTQNSMRNYYRLINGVDNSLKQILDELKKREMDKNTVIIYYSDNGHFMDEHGFNGKWLMYEESIRVPGFIYNPRAETNGTRTDELVLNIDIAPTIMDIAGLEIPADMEGKSLLPLLQEPALKFRDEFLYEHHYKHMEDYMHIERSEGIRTKNWSYIHYIDQKGPESEELYNVKEDPLQLNDRSENADYEKLLTEMRNKVNAYLNN